jgi:beta-galactosidase/beta-glucuronidase
MGIKLLFIESGINLPYYYNFLKMSDTSDTFHFTNNEEENYELLQLLLEKCPPNEIISNKYSPDVVAKIQLMYAFTHPGSARTLDSTTYNSPRLSQKTQKWMTTPTNSTCSTTLAGTTLNG